MRLHDDAKSVIRLFRPALLDTLIGRSQRTGMSRAQVTEWHSTDQVHVTFLDPTRWPEKLSCPIAAGVISSPPPGQKGYFVRWAGWLSRPLRAPRLLCSDRRESAPSGLAASPHPLASHHKRGAHPTRNRPAPFLARADSFNVVMGITGTAPRSRGLAKIFFPLVALGEGSGHLYGL
jgi:hypothetical protein